MIGRLIGTGRGYGMEMNVEKTKAMWISRQPSPIKIMIDQKQLETVEHFNYLSSMITNGAGVHLKLSPRLPWQKQHSTRRRLLSPANWIYSKGENTECYIWSIASYAAEMWSLRKEDHKYLENFEVCCWRRMEKISWTVRVRNEEVLHTHLQSIPTGSTQLCVEPVGTNWR
jgi:hypothetical protein